MSIQEQRMKAYEEWEIRENGYRPEDFSRVNGEYRYSIFREGFARWNAALDSVVIKLPFKHWIDSNSSHAWGAYEAEEVVAALEAAGLKVKP